MKTQAQSLASLHGLKIWSCRELWCRLQMVHGSQVAVPGLKFKYQAWKTQNAAGSALKRKKKKKKKMLDEGFTRRTYTELLKVNYKMTNNPI